MKQLPSERSSIAWFKLAEYVGRGDRERAFGLYRLLVHSVDDQPFLKKLEADIWSAFDIYKSQELYEQAAHLYKNAGNFSESLLIYELLTAHFPENLFYVEQAIVLCDELGLEKKKQEFNKRQCHALLSLGRVEKSLKAFQTLEKNIRSMDVLQFHKEWVIAALTHHYSEQETIKIILQKVLDGYLRMAADTELSVFLVTIKQLNPVWYKDAFGYCESQK